MTPEALREYLVAKGFDEDATHSAICSYLSTTSTIRFPKAWCWQAAVHARQNQAMKDRAATCPELSQAVDRANPDPLRVAIARQGLSRALSVPPKRPLGRPRNGGPQAWQEDYRALCEEG